MLCVFRDEPNIFQSVLTVVLSIEMTQCHRKFAENRLHSVLKHLHEEMPQTNDINTQAFVFRVILKWVKFMVSGCYQIEYVEHWRKDPIPSEFLKPLFYVVL